MTAPMFADAGKLPAGVFDERSDYTFRQVPDRRKPRKIKGSGSYSPRAIALPASSLSIFHPVSLWKTVGCVKIISKKQYFGILIA